MIYYYYLIKEKRSIFCDGDSTLLKISASKTQYTYEETRCQVTGGLRRV